MKPVTTPVTIQLIWTCPECGAKNVVPSQCGRDATCPTCGETSRLQLLTIRESLLKYLGLLPKPKKESKVSEINRAALRRRKGVK